MIALSVAAFYGIVLLWYGFVIAMALKRARERAGGSLPWPVLALGYPVVIAGFALDIALNCTLFTVLFLRPPNPRRLTVSARLKHTLAHGSGYRKRIARWFDSNLIGPIAPDHLH